MNAIIISPAWMKSRLGAKTANWKIYILLLGLFLATMSSCSQEYHPVNQKNKNYRGHTGRHRCNAAMAKNYFKLPKNARN